MDYRTESPEILRDFLTYHETIKGHSKKTVDEYFLDLRTFFRFLKLHKKLAPTATSFDAIGIMDVSLELIAAVTISDVYEFLAYLARERPGRNGVGLSASSRARKIATIRSFYKYLTVKKNLLKENPMTGLDSPKSAKSLPRFLSLDESRELLNAASGKNQARDYCILTLFLNCGLRVSELVGLNLSDFSEDSLRVLGKGNKVRVVYLNDSCIDAVNDYIAVRKSLTEQTNERAFFLSDSRASHHARLTRDGAHYIVKRLLLKAGLDSTRFSSHKLRHTAATLMLRSGVDVRTLQELLGHEHLNTTQIYTHVESDSLREAARLNPLAEYKPSKSDKVDD
ncbi:MAG: tyrosine recombinase XerC [Oscillospiraceae bacterium]|nr:tyrosine recombinase XerC [Oscillospiraceae bacterium]